MENAIPPCGFDRFSKWAFLGLLAEDANTHAATALLLAMKTLERCTQKKAS